MSENMPLAAAQAGLPLQRPSGKRVRVVHCQYSDFDLYIGRAMPRYKLEASPLGNPFRSPGQDNVAHFRRHFHRSESLRTYAREAYQAHVRGHPGTVFRIACWCKKPSTPDAPCHGDVIRDYLERLP